jgi:hypothetical protein
MWTIINLLRLLHYHSSAKYKKILGDYIRSIWSVRSTNIFAVEKGSFNYIGKVSLSQTFEGYQWLLFTFIEWKVLVNWLGHKI